MKIIKYIRHINLIKKKNKKFNKNKIKNKIKK